jgi:hypothetical protein
MDLTRLYNLTTSELRAEAERLGVTDTYAMSRGQLIQAIRDRDAPASERPSGLLGKVFGFAKWALQAAGETRVESEPASAEVRAEPTAPLPVPTLEPSPPPVAKAPRPATREVAPTPAEPPERPAEPDRPDRPDEPDEPDTPQSGPPSRPPAGVFSNHEGLFDEPIPTRTMARILAEQGHYKRSLAIYSKLLDEEPADAELLEEAATVREEARARRSQAPP